MRRVASLLLIALAATGCAAGHFQQVSFAGEASPTPADSVGRTVHVVKNGEMRDAVLEEKIRLYLEDFLLERGFVIAPSDKADLYVLATYGFGPRIVGSTAAVFRPAEVKVQHSPSGQVTGRSFTPDRMVYLRTAALENSVWLMVLSSDAKYFRATGQVRNLWRGEAAMKGTAETLPVAVPYLIVPALKFFGRGTQQTLLLDVREREVAWKRDAK